MKRWLTLLLLIGSFKAGADCRNIALATHLDHDRLWRDFVTLASDEMQGRKPDSPGSDKSRAYLIEQFEHIGLGTFSTLQGYRMPFSGDLFGLSFNGVNIVGWLKGRTYPQRYIVVTAHYDHLGQVGRKIFNGADDNASGVAAMMALARYLKQHGSQYSVIFVATDAEEKGLLGAKAFMRSPPVPVAQMMMNLNLDMLSQNSHRQRLYIYGAQHYDRFKPVLAQLKAQSNVCVKSGRRRTLRGMNTGKRINWRMASDHGVFGKYDVPYLFAGVSEHRYYHTENDTVENVDRGFYLKVAETVLTLFKLLDALQPFPEKHTAP